MTPAPASPLARLVTHWVYGGALAGVLLLALTPLLTAGWPRGETAAFLALPAYMLHQWEEHDDDRFRRFVNTHLAHGREALTPADVFIINIPGVWGTIGLALWLMRDLAPGWGSFAGWILIVNGAAHLAQAIAMRRPNPGLWTGTLVFLPLGAAILAMLPATLAQHAVTLAAVILLHGVIIARLRAGARR